MNGRVYDPLVGRFLSPDPIIQAPELTQSYNRYSYVQNRPLSYIDPSGFTSTNDLAGCAFPPCFMPREPPEGGGDRFSERSRDPRSGGYTGASETGIPPNWRADSLGCDMVGCLNDFNVLRGYVSNVHTSMEQGFFGLVPRWVFEFADPLSPAIDTAEAAWNEDYSAAGLGIAALLFRPTRALAEIRTRYVQELDDLVGLGQSMRAAGVSLEDAARILVAERNQLKLDLRVQGSWIAARTADLRNLVRYGNRAGPTADQLYQRYGSWDRVLNSVGRSNASVDRVLGAGQ